MLNPNMNLGLYNTTQTLGKGLTNTQGLGEVKNVEPGSAPKVKTNAVWKGHRINDKIMIDGKPKLEKGDICITDDGSMYRYNGKNNWTIICGYYEQVDTIVNALEPNRGDIRSS